jgi:hypothetical protein
MSSWLEISDLKQAKYSREGMLNEQSFVFPEPTQSVDESAEQLGSAVVAALASEGLRQRQWSQHGTISGSQNLELAFL